MFILNYIYRFAEITGTALIDVNKNRGVNSYNYFGVTLTKKITPLS